jgi:hypothetical protein
MLINILTLCNIYLNKFIFTLRGHKFKSRGGLGMHTSVDFISQIAGQKGVPCPTNKGVSYTKLTWLGRDLRNSLLLLLLLYKDI